MNNHSPQQLHHGKGTQVLMVATVAASLFAFGCTSRGYLADSSYDSKRRSVVCNTDKTMVCRVGKSSRIRGAQKDYICSCASLAN